MLSMYEGLDYDYNRSLENVKIIISIIYFFTVLFDSRYRENLDIPILGLLWSWVRISLNLFSKSKFSGCSKLQQHRTRFLQNIVSGSGVHAAKTKGSSCPLV